MTKIAKNLGINILLLLFTFVLPLYALNQYQNNANIGTIQIFVFIILMAGSGALIYLNNKSRIEMQNLRVLWMAFEVIGFLGAIYPFVILALVLIFSLGIGF
jgi:hypothetical protein